MNWSFNKARVKKFSFCVFILTAHSTALSEALIIRAASLGEALLLYTVGGSSYHMMWACHLHATGMHKLTLDHAVLIPDLTR